MGRVKLLRKAYPLGLDPDTGAEVYRFESLSSEVAAQVKHSNPLVISKLEGDVALIGFNLMAAWGLQADPFLGLVVCNRTVASVPLQSVFVDE